MSCIIALHQISMHLKLHDCSGWIWAISVLVWACLSLVTCVYSVFHLAFLEAIAATSDWWKRGEMRFWGLQMHILHPLFRGRTDGQEQVHGMPFAWFHTMTSVFYGCGWASVGQIFHCVVYLLFGSSLYLLHVPMLETCRSCRLCPQSKTPNSLLSVLPVPRVSPCNPNLKLLLSFWWHREPSNVNLSEPSERWKCRHVDIHEYKYQSDLDV